MSVVNGSEVVSLPLTELNRTVRPVTFIKMDIEGAEIDALRGAAEIVRQDKPVLALCVYHLQSDIWKIPLLMRELFHDYRFYLRCYEGDGWQTVAYAVPPSRTT